MRRCELTGWRFAPGAVAVLICAIFAMYGAGVALASDPPHWLGAASTTDCTTPCHISHHAQGGGLTSSAGNVNLCQSCHNSGELPINSSDTAVPGIGGTSHGFDVPAVHATLDTLLPQNTDMQLRVMDGNIVCSTCHNQHSAVASFGGRSRVGTANPVVDLLGSGELSSGGTFTGAAGMWYLVDITETGSESTARFRYSKDNAISWTPSDCSPAATATCLTAGTGVALDNGVDVTFSGIDAGAFVVGERWEFSASWPFLRIALDSGDNTSGDKYCRDCHGAWVMTHTEVHTWDDTFKSHPVGVALSANGQGYDRGVPLDGDGQPQNGASPTDVDGNPTNDLLLDGSGNVQCISCHGVHYADSNTSSVDGP